MSDGRRFGVTSLNVSVALIFRVYHDVMDLYLVRHGDTALGPDGLYPDPAHLSETGHAQARALALRLDRIAPHALITSGVLRADETAAPFVSSSGIRPVIVPGFDEIGIGDLRSRDPAIVKARLAELPPRSDFSEYGGESSSKFAHRVIEALHDQVLDRFDHGQRVAAIIHGGPINVILDWIDNGGFAGVLTRHILPASVTLLRRRSDGLHVIYESDTSHLNADGDGAAG